MTLLCITASMPGRSCTIRDHHLSTCQWAETKTGRECSGCLPRPAETGLLCRSCFTKFEAALSNSVDLITHLRSIDRGAQSLDGIRTQTVVQPSYPQSWQEADALWMLLWGVAIAHAFEKGIEEPARPYWTGPTIGFSFSATVDMVAIAVRGLADWIQAAPADVVARTTGAEAAVDYYRETQRALAMFPLQETPTAVKYIKCRTCQQKKLRYMPPLEYMDAIAIQCSNCNTWWDPQFIEHDMKVLAQEIEEEHKRMNAAQEAGLCGIDEGAGGCVYLPHITGPHSWQTAIVTVLNDGLNGTDDAA